MAHLRVPSKDKLTMEETADFLARLPLFKGFSLNQIGNLVEQSQVKTYDANEVIIRFSQPGRFLGIVVEGEAEAVITGESGQRRRLGWLRQGDFLGEMSLLTGEPTSVDVVAVEKCQIPLTFVRSLRLAG